MHGALIWRNRFWGESFSFYFIIYRETWKIASSSQWDHSTDSPLNGYKLSMFTWRNNEYGFFSIRFIFPSPKRAEIVQQLCNNGFFGRFCVLGNWKFYRNRADFHLNCFTTSSILKSRKLLLQLSLDERRRKKLSLYTIQLHNAHLLLLIPAYMLAAACLLYLYFQL